MRNATWQTWLLEDGTKRNCIKNDAPFFNGEFTLCGQAYDSEVEEGGVLIELEPKVKRCNICKGLVRFCRSIRLRN